MTGPDLQRMHQSPVVRFYACFAQIILPSAFHDKYGGSIVATFSDVLRDSRAHTGFFGRLVACGEEYLGLVLAAIREHAKVVRDLRRSRSSQSTPSRRFDMTWLPGEFRYSLRSLAKTPGLVLSAALALALGIAATTTMFSVSHGLLRDLPYDGADRLVYVGIDPSGELGSGDYRLSPPEIVEWREQQSTLEGLAGYRVASLNLSGTGERPERVSGARVTANAFEALRVHPIVGRGFLPDEERPGAEPVVILGYTLWENHYGLDPGVLGRTIRVNGVQRSVVGVMPEGFHFPEVHNVWIPLELDLTAVERGEGRYLHAFGRLADEKTLEDARVEYATLSRRLGLEYPNLYDRIRMQVIPYKQHFVELDAVLVMNVMVAVVGFVLIIACANVANLLLARAAARSREIAVRTALGASRTRVMGQMLAESLVISMIGGVLGVALAVVGVRAFNAPIAPVIPFYWMDIRVDGTVLLFTIGLILFSSVIAGTAPALKVTSVNVNAVLKDQALGVSGLRLGRLSRVLVVAQVALSCGLLTVSGLMVKDVLLNTESELAFATNNVLTAGITLLAADYPEEADRDRFYRELVSRLEGQPGVATAAVTSHLPGVARGLWRIQMEGVVYDDYRQLPNVSTAAISPEFFRALDVGLIEGRGFTASDNANSQPVTIVNRTFAKRFFLGASPLGRQIRIVGPDSEGDWMTIVGVAPFLGMNRRIGANAVGIYMPYSQQIRSSMSLLVQAHGDPIALVPAVREVVASLDPQLPIYEVNSLAEMISLETMPQRVFSILFVCCGTAALVLAVVGLYGVMAFTVRRRTREIGIRMALGAKTRRILWLGFRGGFAQLLLGLLAGVCLAALIAPRFGDLFEDASPWDWKIYLTIALALLCSGIVASVLPALRATRVDPTETLRYE